MRLPLILMAIIGAAACGGGEGSPDATVDAFIPQPGRVHATWTIRDINGPTTCEAVGATTVVLRLATPGGDEEYDVFPCTDGQGLSSFHDPQVYFGNLLLVDMFGGLYAGSLESNVIVPADGSTVEMAPVEFMVQPPGGFELTLDAGAPGGNCAWPAGAGAAISGVTFNLLNVDAQCVTRDMQVAAGPTSLTPAGSYSTACLLDEATAPCIESDQVVSLGNLPPGTYNFLAVGWIGTTDCFEARAHIDIGVGETVSVGALSWMRDTTNPGCLPP
jgi:hypothetical protein